MKSWKHSRALTGETWSVVKANRYLMLFPAAAATIAIVLVLIIGGIGLGILGVSAVAKDIANEEKAMSASTLVIGIVVLIIAAYIGTLISQIFMGGLVYCADEELQGRKSSFGAGLKVAMGRIGALLGWAGIQTSVGWLLSLVRGGDSGNNIFVTILRLVLGALLSVAWSVVTFFVLPLIILRGKGPVAAIKESFSLIRQTWGTSLGGGVRIGGLVALLGILPGVIMLLGGGFLAVAGKSAFGLPLLALGVIVLIAASVLVSALRAVFSVALLHYVEDKTGLGPFSQADLQSAVSVKR